MTLGSLLFLFSFLNSEVFPVGGTVVWNLFFFFFFPSLISMYFLGYKRGFVVFKDKHW